MIKQVIVVRNDLGMRKGKIAAQVAHASMGVFFDRMTFVDVDKGLGYLYELWVTHKMALWMEGTFTKVVAKCNSEDELLNIHTAAAAAGLPTKLIQDAGKTEFHGVPTFTCVAIGPAEDMEIDKITGELSLL